MGLNQVIFNKGQGGLGAPLPGEDHFSGIIIYSDADLPEGFTEESNIKKVFSLEQAEALGIVGTHRNETVALAVITQTDSAPTQGDKIVVSVTNDIGEVTTLCTVYAAAGATITSVATQVNEAINANSGQSGYSSEETGSAEVTISAPGGSGLAGNNYVIAVDITGATGFTLVQFSGGVESDMDWYHYHIAEFFRIQSKGVLWIGIFPNEDFGVFDAVPQMQNFAVGKLRQLGIVQIDNEFDVDHIGTIQTLCTVLELDKKPVSVIYGANIVDWSLEEDLEDLRTNEAPNVSVTIGQDGAGLGNYIYRAIEESVGMVGTILGAVALSKVNETIEWVAKFNIANVEFETLAFANGDTYNSKPKNELDTLNDWGFIFGIKYTGQDGSYISGSNTCDLLNSDYAKIESVRTIDKADRMIYIYELPALGSGVTVQDDGTLTPDTCAYFETLAQRALEQMQRDGEISTFAVTINPAQNVLSTGELVIKEEIVPKGVARKIVNNIGFTTKINP